MEKQIAETLDYGFSMAVKAMIEAMAMRATNKERESNGEAPAYTEKDFKALIEENEIHPNAIISRWQGK